MDEEEDLGMDRGYEFKGKEYEDNSPLGAVEISGYFSFIFIYLKYNFYI